MAYFKKLLNNIIFSLFKKIDKENIIKESEDNNLDLKEDNDFQNERLIENISIYSINKDIDWRPNPVKLKDMNNFLLTLFDIQNIKNIKTINLSELSSLIPNPTKEEQNVLKNIENIVVYFPLIENKDEEYPWVRNEFLSSLLGSEIYTYNDLLVFCDFNEIENGNKTFKNIDKFEDKIIGILKIFNNIIVKNDNIRKIVFRYGAEEIEENNIKNIEKFYYQECYQKIKPENIIKDTIEYKDNQKTVDIYYKNNMIMLYNKDINQKINYLEVFYTPFTEEQLEKEKKYIFNN